MKFPVYISLVVIGSDEKETKIGLLETDNIISLAGARLNEGENSVNIALELAKKYIGSTDPNLFFINRGGFVDAPNRYEDSEQDVVLIYRITIPLHTSLNDGMEWKDAEYCNENRVNFLKDHFDIINMAFQYGQTTHR